MHRENVPVAFGFKCVGTSSRMSTPRLPCPHPPRRDHRFGPELYSMNMHDPARTEAQENLADVLATVSQAGDLSSTRRRDLASAVTSTARLLNRNPNEVPADMDGLRQRLAAIHPTQAGITAKRFANIKADLAAALRIQHSVRQPIKRLAPSREWRRFFRSLEKPWQRHCLSRLARYCTE